MMKSFGHNTLHVKQQLKQFHETSTSSPFLQVTIVEADRQLFNVVMCEWHISSEVLQMMRCQFCRPDIINESSSLAPLADTRRWPEALASCNSLKGWINLQNVVLSGMKRNWQLSLQMVDDLDVNKLKPDEFTFNSLSSAFSSAARWQDGLHIGISAESARNWAPTRGRRHRSKDISSNKNTCFWSKIVDPKIRMQVLCLCHWTTFWCLFDCYIQHNICAKIWFTNIHISMYIYIYVYTYSIYISMYIHNISMLHLVPEVSQKCQRFRVCRWRPGGGRCFCWRERNNKDLRSIETSMASLGWRLDDYFSFPADCLVHSRI